MAPESTALTTKVGNGTPYQLDNRQIVKATSALLRHITTTTEQKDAAATKKNLLATDNTSQELSSSDSPIIWLILTTKKFMTDQKRLKPRKIALPHSLNFSVDTSICLITPEPQRLFKDAITHPSFPIPLSKRISKVISIEKLGKKYHSFESKRQLRDSYDIFLADDRIITYLAKILGKTFYKSTQKRPIPIHLQASKPKAPKNAALPSTKLRKEATGPTSIASPTLIAKEIERTLSTTQIHLTPSTTTAVKVGLASFTPEQIAANIEAVMGDLTGKLIAWRNVKSIYVKGPETTALPVWLADELWTDEGMILEDDELEEAKLQRAQKKKKRRAIEAPGSDAKEEIGSEKKRKSIDGLEIDGESKRKKERKLEDGDLSREMKERREKLRQQKKEAREKIEQGNGANKLDSAKRLPSRSLDVKQE